MNHKQRIRFSAKYFFQLVFFGSFLFLLAGCEDTARNNSNYSTEAEAICEAFNPEFWSTATENLEPFEIQELLADRLATATQSEEMKLLLADLKNLPIVDRYDFYEKSVRELTGAESSCPAIKDYFSL